jgi:hypothetical protein
LCNVDGGSHLFALKGSPIYRDEQHVGAEREEYVSRVENRIGDSTGQIVTARGREEE